jgi:3-oxoacyl-(acyl-carrier-protein) synthase/NAD(P)-dependent dehydrogenase (short-subunit alcohol dehydrogenase family)/SAM-dependent methyltransferase
MSARTENLTVNRRTIERLMQALDRASQKLEQNGNTAYTPVAIVGMACRFPGGADSPERFKDLLFEGRDAIREMPSDRWHGAGPSPRGGFLNSIRDFDAEFFGISAREALSLDPQQRFLLELTWEVLERAGIPPTSLRGSPTGVFTGVTAMDYARIVETSLNPDELGGYFMTGNALNFCAGRVAWKFGLEGPAITVDTACSSSLAAIHLACQSLRAGECTLAIAGGVNLISWPAVTESLTKAGMLAADGRCRTFSADATGYGRGEGCGVLVLEPLSDAVRNGREILAVIRGSAINQDGASSGLTVPNGLAQQAVIRAALKAARVKPEDVDYLECHGTGTPLGDPVEVHAAASVYGPGREQPLLIGSVKTNIGHLEAAAGIAAVFKTVLALQEGAIPAHLHFTQPNPHIEWADLPISVVTKNQPWPPHKESRFAAVSSFGASGTNVHLILEQAPAIKKTAATPSDRTRHLLILSARSPTALTELARQYRDLLAAAGPAKLGDICFSAATCRSTQLSHRLAAEGNYDAIMAQLRNPGQFTGEDIAYQNSGFNRVPLPVYPFQRQPFWPARQTFSPELAERIARATGIDPAIAAKVLAALSSELAGTTPPEQWYYRLQWRPKPAWIPQTDFFPPNEKALRDVEAITLQQFNAESIRRYLRLIQALEEVAAAYALVALQRTAWSSAPSRVRLFDRLVEMAATAERNADPKTMLAAVAAAWPEAKTEVAMIERCGDALADALRDQVDATALLFPATGEPTAADLYNNAFGARVMNAALTAAVTSACANIPASRRLRVLEIGAGTGSATASVLDALPQTRTEYFYTDVSAGFFGRAKARFGDRKFIRYQTFDAELPPAHQGIEPHSIDLVVASNVLHATRDMAVTLRNIAEVLAPGGMLVLLEAIQPMGFTDVIFGLSDGWWRFEDRQLRPNHPLLSRKAWFQVLRQSGFDDCAAVVPRNNEAIFALQTIIAARVPETPARQPERLILADRQGFANELSTSTSNIVEIDQPYSRLLEKLPAPDQIVYCSVLDSDRTALQNCASLLHLTRHAHAAKLFVLTQGTLTQSVLNGFCASLDIERPDLASVRIDLDPSKTAAENARFARAELLATDGERSIAYRNGERLVARLVAEPQPVSPKPAISAATTWLITGGLNGLGFLTAEWLAERGAANLALLSRRTPDESQRAQIDGLQRKGIRIETFAADISDEAQLQAALDTIRRTMPPLAGVIHSAGVLADGMIADQTERNFQDVFAPKVAGAWNLHRLTLSDPLTHFILYSTGISLLGSPGQSNHAAANAFLNALAEYRRTEGLPGLSLAWGRWSETGSAASEAVGESSKRRGMRSITPERGRQALDDLFDAAGTVGVFAADWRVLTSQFPGGAPPLFSELLEVSGPSFPVAGKTDLAALARQTLASRSPAEKETLTGKYLNEAVRQILGRDASPLPDAPLVEMGFDSLVSTELRNRLLFDLKIDIPMKSLLSGVSVRQLQTLVLERLLLTGITSSAGAPAEETPAQEAIEEFLI